MESPLTNTFEKVALLFFALFLALALVEVGLRLYGYDLNPAAEWRFDRRAGWTIDPTGTLMDKLTCG